MQAKHVAPNHLLIPVMHQGLKYNTDNPHLDLLHTKYFIPHLSRQFRVKWNHRQYLCKYCCNIMIIADYKAQPSQHNLQLKKKKKITPVMTLLCLLHFLVWVLFTHNPQRRWTRSQKNNDPSFNTHPQTPTWHICVTTQTNEMWRHSLLQPVWAVTRGHLRSHCSHSDCRRESASRNASVPNAN